MCLASGNEGMRLYSDASAWIKILEGDTNTKLLFYRNNTCEGWDLVSGMEGRLVAIKGTYDSVTTYNVSGGGDEGNYTYSGFTFNNETAHTHGSGTYTMKLGTYGTTRYGDTYGPVTDQGTELGKGWESGTQDPIMLVTGTVTGGVSGTVSHTHTDTYAGTDRPRAAVCTLQKPDLT